MDKLNKYYLDSSWHAKSDVKEQIKIIKSVAKDTGLFAKIKITKAINKHLMYDVHVKLNRIEK